MKMQPEVRHKCIGCGADFDSPDDLCHGPHSWSSGTGTISGDLCEQCHVTALGAVPPHSFRQFDAPNKKAAR